MPLVSIHTELLRAREMGYGVPLFDTFDSLSVDGMVAALAEADAPGIIAIYSGSFDQPNAAALAAYIRVRLAELPQAASLMLDHGSSLEQCMRAIHLGFTDVMFDGSKLSFEENLAETKAIVRAAHAVGVKVEAELGHVGSGSEYQNFGGQRKGFTDPAAAERFAAETGVDFLAIAIGTAHGVYVGDPQLDLELLADVRRRVSVPLVLHGGSGLSEEQFRGAVRCGISKINVATELILTAGKRMVAAAGGEKKGYFDLARTAVETYKERCLYYLNLFGTSTRGLA
jgi:fructose-bisphosphate aldolase class II